MVNKKTIVDKLKSYLEKDHELNQLFFLNSYQMGQLHNIQLVTQLNILLENSKSYNLSFSCYEILKEYLPLSFVDAY
ncbi:hypothetical protein OHW18_17350, partial [Acinetobacter baumannii]|nr:hypothetical protein [Acinetobacter baumannii]